MRVLVAYGSKMGGTRGLCEMLAAALERRGLEADVRSAAELDSVAGYDAVIVGGALYANRWHRAARRFVRLFDRDLRERPVWLFSSGPLDDSATAGDIPPVRQVARLMSRVGAVGHVTFGGRLPADARGFPARAMARENAGDWRDPDHVDRFADEVARALRPAVGAG